MTGSVTQKITSIQAFPLFSGVSPADCANVVSVAREKIFSRKQTIFAEGDAVHQTLLLTSGCVKLKQFGQDGSEVILRLAGPGEVVGAVGRPSTGGHGATAQTTESSAALVWERANFEGLLDRFPVLRRNMILVLEARLQDMDQRFREISTQKVAHRLSNELIRLITQVGKQVNGDVEISLSRAELAQLTGTTLFTVSRLLSQWKMQGIVNVRRESVTVRNLPALQELSEAESEPPLSFYKTCSAD